LGLALGDRHDRISELDRLLSERDARIAELETPPLSDEEIAAARREAAVDAFDRHRQTTTFDRRLDYSDDLQRIDGVSSGMEAILRDHHVETFYQLAVLDELAVEGLEHRIGLFPGRVTRDDWVPQASQLHLDEHGEDLSDRVVLSRSGARRGLDATGVADFFEANLARSKAERPDPTSDDLKPIKGIGKKMSRLLRKNGLTTLYQLARLDQAAIDDFEARTDLSPGRIRRENWVHQAADRHFKEYGEQIDHVVTVDEM